MFLLLGKTKTTETKEIQKKWISTNEKIFLISKRTNDMRKLNKTHINICVDMWKHKKSQLPALLEH